MRHRILPGMVLYLAAGAWPIAFGPPPCRAQGIICCNLLLSFEGSWIGASRKCEEHLAQAPRDKRMKTCQQLREQGALCSAVEKLCRACSGRDGDGTYPPDHPVVQQIIQGFLSQGLEIGPEHILVQDDEKGFVRFVVRLDKNGCVLPDGQCVMEAVTDGAAPQGKQEAAAHHLYGGIQVSGKMTRVWTRVVRIETGIVIRAGKADGSGPQPVTTATSASLGKMGMPCKKARGLMY